MLWADAVKQAILEVPAIRYGASSDDNPGDGCPADLVFCGKKLLNAADELFCHCCGTTTWVLLRAFQIAGLEGRVTLEQAQALKKYAFVSDWKKHPERLRGVAGGLVDLGLATMVPVEEATLGDFCQIQWHAKTEPESGHSVAVTAFDPAFNGSPALWAFSSNLSTPKYPAPQEWARDHLRRKAGTQHDYTRIKPERAFHVARLAQDLIGGEGA